MPEEKKLYTLEEAGVFLSLTKQYVRTLVRHKQIASELLPMREGSLVKKHHIRREELIRYRDTKTRRTKRPDNRLKYIIYIHDKELDLVVDALHGAGLEGAAGTIQPANKRKPK